MKFNIRDLLLLVPLVAVTFWGFSINKTLGRHLLVFALSLSSATVFGLTLNRYGIRTKCAIGSLVGTSIYGIITHVSKDWIFETDHYFSKQTLFYEPQWLVDISGAALFSATVFSSFAPFLIVIIEKHELNEEQKIDQNMSGALLFAIGFCYLMLVLDGWRTRYLESNWMTVFLLLNMLFVLVTFPWIGEHFKARQVADSGHETASRLQPVGTDESQSPEQQD